MANRWGKIGNSGRFFSWAPKSLRTMTAAMKLKDASPRKKSYDRPRQHFKKQRHHFVDKVLYSQSYNSSSSHVWMWELDHKKVWAPNNWCFQIVVLEKTLEGPLDSKEINQSILKEINAEYSLEGLILVLQYFGHLIQRANSWEKTDAWKDWRQKKKGWQRMRYLDGITNSTDMNLSRLGEILKDREAWGSTVHGVAKSQTQLSG